MVPLVIQLPLDPTGTSPNNAVVGEPHPLIANRTFRAIAPFQGAYFMASMQVFDAATGTQLTDGSNGTVQQYYCCEYYELPSERYGQEIDAIVIVSDPSVSNNVTINYQALGGPYGTSAQAIIQQIEALGLDNRPVAWGDIIGKPSEFPPSFHLHDIGDVYGFEYVVHALDRIRDAIEIGDQASHDIIYSYIDAAIASVQGITDSLQAQLTAHITNMENPHNTTAGQVGAYTTAQSDSNLSTAVTTLNGTITANVNALNASIATKASSSLPFAFQNQTVTFLDVHANGTIYSANDVWAFVSDERLKRNVKPILNALARVKQLTGITYQHNDLAKTLAGIDTTREYMGLIAQDVRKVAPQVVGPAPFDIDAETGESKTGANFITVQYEKLVALLVEAVKELAHRVERTEEQLYLTA